MGRPPRVQVAGGVYHVTARGNRRQTIVTDDRDAGRFFDSVAAVTGTLGWRCHAYCLMPNHYHLVLETPNADLSVGMHRINTRYAHWFNHRHEVDGHLFQRRFHSVLIEGTVHLLEVLRYVPLNPVRAGLCSEPAAWPWSSFPATAGLVPGPAFLAVDRVLELFGDGRERARRRFVSFVRNASPLSA